MSIDASLNKLQEMHNIMEYEIELIKEPDEKAWNREFINSLETAISTMCKYQKIQEIVKQKDYDRFNSRNYYGYFLRVQDIRKVLEDGNNYI